MFWKKKLELNKLDDSKKVVPLTQPKVGDQIIYRPVKAGLYQHKLTREKVYTIRPSFMFVEILNDDGDRISILSDERRHFQLVIDKPKPTKKISKRSRKKYGKTKKSNRD